MKALKISILIIFLHIITGLTAMTDLENRCFELITRDQADSAYVLLTQNLINNESHALYVFKGVCEYGLKQYSLSIESMIKADNYTIDIANEENRLNQALNVVFRGLSYKEIGNRDSSIVYLKKALDLDHDKYDWLIELVVRALIEQGDENGLIQQKRLDKIGEKVSEFKLPDLYGRLHSSQELQKTDYILHFGTTWCGSCQSDAKDFNAFVQAYKDRKLSFADIFIGESPNTVLDFQKHYRANTMALLDFSGIVAQQYHINNFTATHLISKEGFRLFNKHDVFYDKEDKYSLINEIDKLSLSKKDKQSLVCDSNFCYVPQTVKDYELYELSPKAVADKKGNVWVVFYSNRTGNNDIYLRCYKKEKITNEIRITKELSDDYSPDIFIDHNQKLWLCWVSNINGKYDIYACTYKNDKLSEPTQITFSKDDAFHPALACNSKNDIFITYYKWDFLGHLSRDRDVFMRKYQKNKWSTEIRISPSKPDFDDATDPVIICSGKDSVYVAYSYDYHPGCYLQEEQAYGPTIFMQNVSKDFDENNQTLIGTKETTLKYVADISPALCNDKKDNIWVCWDAHFDNYRSIFVKKSNQISETLLTDRTKVCINSFINVDHNDNPFIVWAQQEPTGWVIAGSECKNSYWSESKVLTKTGIQASEPVWVLSGKEKYLIYTNFTEDSASLEFKKIKNRIN